MDVRLARVEDAEAIRAIYNAEVTGSTVTFDLEPRTGEQQLAWIAHHQGAHPAIVAVEGATVTGFGSLSAFRDRPAYATTVEDSLYVEQGWRGKGVGRLLLAQLVDLAGAHGFHTVIGRASGDNAASIALHQACGFTLVGVEREVGRKFGRWIDVAVLQRML
ncbi:MAG TPA: GNAT family N-acetyltransferase [Acidimicrobiales bacterium]|nr:GNAT family N-acetyltransferase [Acidimicrobiales bacterium]